MSQPYTLKKSLGQHFLHDEQICQKIISQISPTGKLLEIGPGGGALTKYLLKFPDLNFKAIEFDEEKVQYLKRQFPDFKDKLIHQDFLKAVLPFDGDFNIVGNFPYNISGPILFKILEWENAVTSVVGMFQKEVAKRISSNYGSREYGILSVLLQAFFKVEYLFDVSPECFTPPPKVVSGVIKLTRTGNPYKIEEKERFKKFVKTAFGQRRKKLKNALSTLVDSENLTGKFSEKRAEQLSVGDFVEMYKICFAK